MGLSEDIQQRALEASSLMRCKMGRLLDSLPEVDRASVLYALSMIEEESSRPVDARVFTVKWLTSILNSNGHSIGRTVIHDHLRKDCACE